MTSVTIETLTAKHVKAARVLLDWSIIELSDASRVGTRTIKHFEAGHEVRASTRAKIISALEAKGVQLTTGRRVSVSIPSETTIEAANAIKRVNASIRKRNADRIRRLDKRDSA